jgi:hypothetical protein
MTTVADAVEQDELKTVIPGRHREMRLATAEAYAAAADIYEKAHPELMYRLGWTVEEYVAWLAKVAGVTEPRVRTALTRMARHDWAAFDADVEDPRMAQIDLIDHIDIRWGGKAGWITTTHYAISHKDVVIRNKPHNIDDALAKLRAKGYTVRAYGSTWYRAWPGKPTPVRTTEKILKARQEMDNGRFYIPEDYHVAEGQIDLAYDL